MLTATNKAHDEPVDRPLLCCHAREARQHALLPAVRLPHLTQQLFQIYQRHLLGTLHTKKRAVCVQVRHKRAENRANELCVLLLHCVMGRRVVLHQ
jgi:hypothetical protein